MGDLFIKMAKTNDIIGLGKVGLALTIVSLACDATRALANTIIAIETVAAMTRQRPKWTDQTEPAADTTEN